MRVNPYLLFDGNCEEAFGAYAKIFSGKIVAMMPFEGSPAVEKTPADCRKKILHARLEFGDNALMASDAPPGRFQKMQGMSVTLNIGDPTEAERIFSALSDGGEVFMPMQETFFATRFAQLRDRFGLNWMIVRERPMAST